MAVIDRLLLAIKPPAEIQRTPRSLESTRQYWKGIYAYFFSSDDLHLFN